MFSKLTSIDLSSDTKDLLGIAEPKLGVAPPLDGASRRGIHEFASQKELRHALLRESRSATTGHEPALDWAGGIAVGGSGWRSALLLYNEQLFHSPAWLVTLLCQVECSIDGMLDGMLDGIFDGMFDGMFHLPAWLVTLLCQLHDASLSEGSAASNVKVYSHPLRHRP